MMGIRARAVDTTAGSRQWPMAQANAQACGEVPSVDCWGAAWPGWVGCV